MHEKVPNFWNSSKKCPLHEIIYLRILWKYQLPLQLSKIKEFSLSLCNNTENHDYKDHSESLLNMLYKILIACTPLSAGTRGVEPPTKFSKRGGLDRTSVFRGGLLGKGRLTFSGGEGCNFSTLNKLTSGILNDTKSNL